jgi:hypothetical protein
LQSSPNKKYTVFSSIHFFSSFPLKDMHSILFTSSGTFASLSPESGLVSTHARPIPARFHLLLARERERWCENGMRKEAI